MTRKEILDEISRDYNKCRRVSEDTILHLTAGEVADLLEEIERLYECCEE
jgi:hypothetical protein